MGETESSVPVDGALIPGEDALYFVPKDVLEQYRLPPEYEERAREMLDELHKENAEVAGFSAQLPAVQQWEPAGFGSGAQVGTAVFGPIGRRDSAAGPADPTKVG